MTNSPNPRFRSAAIFAAEGATLKKIIQPQLKPLGWKAAGKWRGFEHRCFWLTPPPRDFTPWIAPGGIIGPVSIRTKVNQSSDCQEASCAALDFLGEHSLEVCITSIALEVSDGPTVALGINSKCENYLTISFYDADRRHVVPPSAELLRPWLGSATCEYGVNPAEQTTKLDSWTIDELQGKLGELPLYSLEIRGISSEQFALACGAVKQEVAGTVKWISHSVEIDHSQCGEIFPLVTERIPGYFFTAFFGSYAKGFDPYARPAAADAGETVRYPLVTCERRRLNKDGEKDLDIDIVHRPQGDCYFDIQAGSFHPADDTVVRNTLAEAIALLDVKAEIWDGDPFVRWQ
jgi:hypothetical protein